MTKSYVGKKETTLVIVESPAKCSKIEGYLGPGYKCVASFGHLRNIQNLEDVDIENEFHVNYTNDERKLHIIDNLKKYVADSDKVILATDDDREGEAIAWHICSLYKLPIEKTKRIVFHEITQTAIQKALENPRFIDMNIVHSQQSRQILDLLVGYKITPLLWKYISRTSKTPLSAGRCQSPALKIIYENQLDIDNSPGKQIYKTIGYFTNHMVPFELKQQYEDADKMSDFLENSVNEDHVYSITEPKRVQKSPPEPLTTSRIQQLLSNELKLSPKDTMNACQVLYENGYITYMRTDSKKYSAEFIETVKPWIIQEYNNEKYVNSQIDLLCNSRERKEEEPSNKPKSNSKSKKETTNNFAQEAHEAIRPTQIKCKCIPEDDKKISSRERKVYHWIWKTTAQSCMSPAEYFSITASLSAYDKNVFVYTEELVDFLGYQIVDKETSNLPKKEKNHYHYLLQLKPSVVLEYKKIVSTITLTNTKHHYTEAKIVQMLEEKGIGRPSTFSSLVEKIQEREYVKKEDVQGREIVCKNFELEDCELTEMNVKKEFGNEKGKLVLQPLGKIVMEFIEKNCSDFLNYEYTSIMEKDLDDISKGTKDWLSLCKGCYKDLLLMIEKVNTSEKKYEVQIDETHIYKIGKYGPMIQCKNADGSVTFEKAKKDLDPALIERGVYKLEEMIEDKTKIMEKTKKQIGIFEEKPLFIKKGKFGLYAEWGEKTKSLSSLGNRPIENIQLEEVLTIVNTTANVKPHKQYEKKYYKKK